MSNNRQVDKILFYSNRCSHCKEFLRKLENTSFKDSFNYFCVDNNYQGLPDNINSVPTILFKENNNILIGNAIFEWLDKTQSAQIQSQTQNKNEEVLAWHSAEMGSSFSDNYSFLGNDTSSKGNGGNSIAHSFSFLNGSDSYFKENGMPKGMGGNQNNSMKKEKDQLTQNMERMMNQRDREIPGPIQRF